MKFRLFVAVLLRITFDCEHNVGMLADSGEPKAMINLVTSFVYVYVYVLLTNEASSSCCTSSFQI